MVGRAEARAPGTCGELVQGVLGGSHFHVTCPVDMYAVARAEAFPGFGRVVVPDGWPKARHAAELVLEQLGVQDVDVRVRLSGSLPRGKGMASSTADVSAAVQATATALGAHLSAQEVAEISLRVEPSDGLMFEGIALFDHREGGLLRLLGPAPPARLLVLDFGGGVNTVAFNAADRREALTGLTPRWREALDMVSEGVRTGDVGLVGRGATASARAHQSVLPKPQLEPVLAMASRTGAAGVVAAHSGTVLGMMFPDDAEMVSRARSMLQESMPGLKALFQVRVVDGGVSSVVRRSQEVTS